MSALCRATTVGARPASTGEVLAHRLFDAWGNELSTGITDPRGYRAQYGYYTDQETGLVALAYRYYAPGVGRFVNRDPIGYGGGAGVYSYVKGRALASVDPLGLIPWQCWWKCVGCLWCPQRQCDACINRYEVSEPVWHFPEIVTAVGGAAVVTPVNPNVGAVANVGAKVVSGAEGGIVAAMEEDLYSGPESDEAYVGGLRPPTGTQSEEETDHLPWWVEALLGVGATVASLLLLRRCARKR